MARSCSCLRCLLATVALALVLGRGFGLLLFELLFQFGALLGLAFGALLALHLKLLFCAEEFNEGFLRPVTLLEAGADDAQIAAIAVAVARRHGVKEALHGVVGAQKTERLPAGVKLYSVNYESGVPTAKRLLAAQITRIALSRRRPTRSAVAVKS